MQKTKRERYKYLTQIAHQVGDILERSDIKPNEGCVIRRIAEDIWNYSAYNESRGVVETAPTLC